MIRNTLVVTILAVLAFGLTTVVQAQDFPMQPQTPDVGEITDEEIRQMVVINMAIQPIQQDLQRDMVAEVEEGGMDLQRFSQIMNALQQGQDVDDLDVSDEEYSVFNELNGKLNELQDDADEEIIGIIEDHGFELDRFQQILMAIQTDQEVQARFMAVVEKMQEEEGY